MSQNVQGEYRTAIDSNWFATESCIQLIYACPEMTIAQFVMPKMSKVKYDLSCKKKFWPEFYTRGNRCILCLPMDDFDTFPRLVGLFKLCSFS